jgi:signal transduction histidine kinase
MVDSLEPLLASRGVTVDIAISEQLRVVGDGHSIGRVLRNLVENAVKYGPSGQTIRLTIERADAGLGRIAVDDQGPGIPREERSRIWQPYYRLDRDRNGSAGGSGIGLAVVADLMRMMAGRAWVGDAPGGGSRFAVEFPLALHGNESAE